MPDMHEEERLASLRRYDVLDTPPEETFDRIARLARRLFGVPIATVSLMDGHRLWFKARQGIAACEVSRGVAFCEVTVGQATPLAIPDTLRDPRFAASPLVVGGPRIRFYAGAPIRSPQGHPVGTVCVMDTVPRAVSPDEMETLSDLARIVAEALELRLVATTDVLTGALSRRGFRTEAGRLVAVSREAARPLGCLVLDLDHFKQINDRHGHAVGDLVLAEAVAACRAALDRPHAMGRLGGEEFGILLPDAGPEEALGVAEALRGAVGRCRVAAPRGVVGVTASVGVATLGPGAETLDGLMLGADRALYAAKSAGRDRCRLWDDPGGASRDGIAELRFEAPPDLAGRRLSA